MASYSAEREYVPQILSNIGFRHIPVEELKKASLERGNRFLSPSLDREIVTNLTLLVDMVEGDLIIRPSLDSSAKGEIVETNIGGVRLPSLLVKKPGELHPCYIFICSTDQEPNPFSRSGKHDLAVQLYYGNIPSYNEYKVVLGGVCGDNMDFLFEELRREGAWVKKFGPLFVF